MTNWQWMLWGVILIAQNFSFTFVSRARNSGSLRRHLIASIFSNGIWFVSQIFAVSAFMSILMGHYGVGKSIFAGVFYTSFTILGSLAAHKWALHSEKGKSAVGASSKYAQIPVEEWNEFSKFIEVMKTTIEYKVNDEIQCSGNKTNGTV